MKNAIVTVCNVTYLPLLHCWVEVVRRLANDLPVYVLCLNSFVPPRVGNLHYIQVSPEGNPFPKDLPDHACAEKVRLFEHLPREVDRVLFIDVDALVLNPFWCEGGFFEESDHQLVMCPDFFVGYKEKMESEFQPYDSSFQMKYYPNGIFFYFNTGVFFASRQTHQEWFRRFMEVWRDYIVRMGQYPSIFDQNVFNYCLIRFGLAVAPMPVTNNCIRQYKKQTIRDGQLLLNGQVVNVYHLNGGDCEKKVERWNRMVDQLEASNDSDQP